MARAATATRSSTNGNGRDPAKELDQEIAALRDDISAITATLADIVKSSGKDLQKEARKVGQQAVAKGEEAISTVQGNYDAVESELKSMIREKPIASVLIAAAVGYVASKIL